MSTNLDAERAIIRRSSGYPEAETQRLLDVIADLRGEPVLRLGVGRTAGGGQDE